MVSRVRRTGLSNRTPCQPSITCGPLDPMPSTNRPPDSACRDIADMASIAGVRAPSCTIPVASRMVEVCPARYASGVRASAAQNSGTHTESTPSRSAWRTSSTPAALVGMAAMPTRRVMATLRRAA